MARPSKEWIKQHQLENLKCELYCDNFENYKSYGIPKAQLIIADIPYNVGADAYGSSVEWYKDGNIKNGESSKANSTFFNRDVSFNVVNFMKFGHRMLKKEPKSTGKRGVSDAPAMIVFHAYEQTHALEQTAKQVGFKHSYPLVFVKKSSSQVLKANMRIVGACEYATVFYRDRLPKFNNYGQMIKNWFPWEVDSTYPKIHPTQKPIPVLKRLIEIFTDPGDVVIDPCAGSGATLRAAMELGRNSYGFEVERQMCEKANKYMLSSGSMDLLSLV